MRGALLLTIVATGCGFDPGAGVPGDPPARPDSAPDDPIDAASPDATPDCIDADSDGAPISLTGADCGPVIDCDDSDARAHPEQTQFFADPRNAGGFDFNCDGVETLINTRHGGDCHLDWFDCEGTGWMGIVPDCGVSGIYHECDSGFLSCNESQITGAVQLCQ